jgi:hypothetical protein
MEAKLCKRFDSCSAPLCPMDESSLANGIWMPDEDICQLQTFCNLNWVRNQKKIARKSRNKDGYFTCKMLLRDCIVGKGVEGLDPDHDISDMEKDEARWLQQHPEKPKISDVKKQELKNRLMKLKLELYPLENDAIRRENLEIDVPIAGDNLT